PAAAARRGTFVLAGGAEQRSAAAAPVRAGGVPPEAMREKVRFVMAAMQARMQDLGFGWKDAAAVRAYTVHDIGALAGPEIAAMGAAQDGLHWHLARPPVVGLEFEMDVRTVAREVLL
ncbi:MAG: hypothetical protein IT514_08875, partial [Burkholderiales bacterium]|nr:hypothetical protein [Burkholderiales bacterium]